MSSLPSTVISTFLANSHQKAANLVQNRRRIVSGFVGAYALASLVLGASLYNLSHSVTTRASASTPEISAVLQLDRESSKLGEVIQGQIVLQNTSTAVALNKLSITLVSTSEQISWLSVKDQAKTLSQNNNTFSFDSLAAQEQKTLTLTGIVAKSGSSTVGIYAQLSAYSFEQVIQTKTATRSLQIAQQSVSGQTITLKTTQPEYKTTDIARVNVSSIDPLDQSSGVVTLTSGGEIIQEYDCTLEEGICEITYKSLAIGTYHTWFHNANTGTFSNVLSFGVVGETLIAPLNPLTEIQTSFGTTSISNRVSVILKEVTTKNATTVSCEILLTHSTSQTTKKFTALSNFDRNCEYFIDTNELSGFGEYTISAPGVTAKKTIFVVESKNIIPLTITTPVLVQTQPVEFESRTVLLGSDNTPYSGVGEALVFNPTTHNLTTTDITFKDGVVSAKIPASSLADSALFYLALRINQNSTQFVSNWNTLNFGSQNLDTVTKGIQINDLNQLRIGGKPSFAITNIRDTSGQLVSGKECSATLYQTGIVQPLVLPSVIVAGVCQVTLEAKTFTKTGPALITFYSNDINKSIAQTRSFDIVSTDIRSVGSIHLAQNPAPVGVANQVLIGPIRDAKDNLITSGNVRVRMAQEAGLWLVNQTVAIENGFATSLVPSSMIDAAHLSINVSTLEEEILSAQEFTTTTTTFAEPRLPFSAESNSVLSVDYTTSSESVSTCALSIAGSLELSEVTPFDIATHTCVVRTAFQAGMSVQNILTFTVEGRSWSQLFTLQAQDANQNFAVLPQTKLNAIGELETTLLTSPLTDLLGLPVTRGTITFKLNGREVTSPITDSIAKVHLYDDFLLARDTRTLFNKRILDLDIEASSTPRSKSTTDKIRITLGARDIATQPKPLGIQQLATTMNVGTVQAVELQSKHCNAWLFKDTFVQLQSIQIQDSCWILLRSDTVGTGTLLLFDEYDQIFSAAITFGENTPQVVITPESGLTVAFQGIEDYQLQATLFDGTKEFTFDGQPNQPLTLTQQGLSAQEQYSLRIRVEDTLLNRSYFYFTVQGSELQN